MKIRTAAIGAHELRDGDILIGDSICPTRYDSGVTIDAVNTTDVDGLALAVIGGRDVEFNVNETVYIARRG